MKTESGAPLGGDVLDESVDAILSPGSERDLRTASGEKARSAFTDAAAGSGNHNHLVRNIWRSHSLVLLPIRIGCVLITSGLLLGWAQVAYFSYQLRTRSARSVFHRLDRLLPSSSSK